MSLRLGERPRGPLLLTARWVVGHENDHHVLLPGGEVVVDEGAVRFVGHGYAGEVAHRLDLGDALIGPGFVDLDALSDLDTTILGFDNQPAWRKGRVWPRSYVERGPYEMYSEDELAYQKRFAFAQLLRNGITTALPIASLFYRQWGETVGEFEAAIDAAVELGLRVYLGPAYRTGNVVVESDGTMVADFDEARGLAELEAAIDFCRRHDDTHGGLVRAMLAPDRVETCTAELLRRSAAAARDLAVPIRLHCCQGQMEVDTLRRLHGTTAPGWLRSLDFLSERSLLPHATYVSGDDLDIIRDSGATIVHCPLVSARHGGVIRSFRTYREAGQRIGMGTDTWPPDMILNMQLGMMLCRVVERDIGAVRAEHYYDAATVGGADALGRPDLGRLRPGARADIAVIDLAHTLRGPDPIQSMMTGASGRDVTTVLVDGRLVMHERRIAGFDDETDWPRAQAQFDGLIARYPERTHGHPPVEEIFSSSYPLRGGAR
ncbi:MAG: amidohydrolase family protein [Ectothiorhodospiraceae bacterium]|nr:amidohydrolase family protein [Ectothiorhodospiraceae bacterium]